MVQYHEIRAQYPDALLLFQVGDFYELFFDDAKKASAFLGIALTKRGTMNGEPIPLCGVPLHALDHYLTKLVKGGFKVAICDQLEEPKPGTVVKRGVTQVLTPGTLTDSKLLDEKSASYLFSFFPTKDRWGLLFGELLTAQLFATLLPTTSDKSLESELVRFFPDEILLPHNKLGKSFQSFFKRLGYFTTLEHTDKHDEDHVKQVEGWIRRQFKKEAVNQLEQCDAMLYALHNFYSYVSRNQIGALEHFRSLHFYNPDDFLLLDASTQKNLELVKNNQDGSRKNTLFALMDKAATSMGSRMVKKWILRPLIKKEAIEQRLDAVGTLVEDISLNQKLHELLVQIGDIERIVGRIALRRAMFNDYLALSRALDIIPELKHLIGDCETVMLFNVIATHIADFTTICGFLKAALNDDTSKEWIIKQGFDKRLDHLRQLVGNSNAKLLELEKKEQHETGINSLKVRYNKVHGYFIEVTKANLHLVPQRYSRQQTLVGRERFTTKELRGLQDEMVRAHAQIDSVEKELFENVKQQVYEYTMQLRKLAHALAHLDALLSFSHVSYDYGYVRPTFNEKNEIRIDQGRHPIVEQTDNITFIPNDTDLSDETSMWIITGPNMGGKSTFLRQVALISVLAQCGSFIPAKSANLALLDRIFTRIGSGDNLAGGKSTFLVEMEETALICHQATKKSLVILDEVGRGTSTFDGLAIAQAVVEYIHTSIKAKCLFATHYHELTALKDIFSSIESYYAASKKTENGIVFLYKIIKGIADGSFGVEVAKLAKLPQSLIVRAKDVLHELENQKHISHGTISMTNEQKSGQYMGASANDIAQSQGVLQENRLLKAKIVDLQAKITVQKNRLKRLQNVDYNDLSPKKAFDLLWEFKES